MNEYFFIKVKGSNCALIMITLLFLGALYELSSCKSNKKFSFHKVKFNKETWSKITFEKLYN